MKRFGLILLLALATPDYAGADVFQDFRGQDYNDTDWALDPAGADMLVKPEPEGLRITVPADRKEGGPVGIRTRRPFKGDFEITTSYEILQVERPRGKSVGVGIELYAITDTPGNDAVSLTWLVGRGGNEVYVSSAHTTTPDGKRKHEGGKPVPGKTRSGRLRMTRAGTVVTFWAAEGTEGQFQQLYQHDLGPEDVRLARVAAYPGGVGGQTVDLRIRDFGVRAMVAPPPDIAEEEPPPPWRLWLLAALVGALLLLAGLWLGWRRPRGAGHEITRPTVGRTTTKNS
jgi:Protein of unknown function (DUF1583)